VLPLTDKTKNFFDKEFFKRMKKDAVFMNIGRGSTCNESALIEALKSHSIKGAVLDVYEKEPLT